MNFCVILKYHCQASTLEQITCGTKYRNFNLTKNYKAGGGDWPWHCAIFHSENGTQSYLCGCSLIRTNTVLTAAHCVYSDDDGRIIDADRIIVHLGKTDLHLAEPYTQAIRVQQIIVHENFSTSNYHNNIAFIQLTDKAKLNQYAKPICLNDDVDSLGESGVSVGWGDIRITPDSRLNQMFMPVVPNSVCAESLPAVHQKLLEDNNTFCAGFINGECLIISRRTQK